MPPKKDGAKDNLPLNIDDTQDIGGTITYANEVIAIIAGVATGEVEGIAGMCTSGGISDILGRNRNITRGVRVEIGSEEASVDLFVIVEYGTPIQKAARDAQENVRKAIETMTGLHVVRVDVHVQGVSFERENSALARGQETAALQSGAQAAKAAEAAPVEEVVVAEVAAVAAETVTAPAEASAAAESAAFEKVGAIVWDLDDEDERDALAEEAALDEAPSADDAADTVASAQEEESVSTADASDSIAVDPDGGADAETVSDEAPEAGSSDPAEGDDTDAPDESADGTQAAAKPKGRKTRKTH